MNTKLTNIHGKHAYSPHILYIYEMKYDAWFMRI